MLEGIEKEDYFHLYFMTKALFGDIFVGILWMSKKEDNELD